MSQSTPEVNYFNLHTAGLGYLSRIRHVDVKRGDGFLACEINALHGRSDEVEYTRFDCRVSGAEAIAQIARCLDIVTQDTNTKILLGFCLGDLYSETFVYRQGERKGQTGVCLKARLIRVDWVKVNGEMIYKAEKPIATSSDA